MVYQDLTDYKPKPVIFVEEEKDIDILFNPLYRPIITILRQGPKTLKEIKEEYKKHTDKKEIPSDKSLYRHLSQLKDAGLIAEAGRRVYTEQTLTEKLFSRTAIFFYARPSSDNEKNKEQYKNQAEILSKIFKLSFDIPQPSVDGILKITNRIRLSNRRSHDELFENHVDELVKIFEGVSSDDLRSVVDQYWIIRLLLEKSEFDDDLKKYLKTI